jgi:glucans biosynthesis protein C
MSIPLAGARRHDIDWLRVIALFFLILYHIGISFQSWGFWIGFVQSPDSLPEIWPALEILNVWRIPILFVISGMGVWFAMARRNWRELIRERSIRLLVPLGMGFVLLCPLTVLAAQLYYWRDLSYEPNVGHLWFLVNLFAYVILLLPVMYFLKHRPNNLWFRFCGAIAKFPPALILFAIPVMIEAWWMDPAIYQFFALTWHGFAIGLICFFFGFSFAAMGERFWKSMEFMRFPFFLFAVGLYVIRVFMSDGEGEATKEWANPRYGLETMCWILAWLGLASRYLRSPSPRLSYLNQAVFPVYILHMPVQNAVCNFILPTVFPPAVKLVLVLFFTLVICFAIYELIIRRITPLRPLFGMNLHPSK